MAKAFYSTDAYGGLAMTMTGVGSEGGWVASRQDRKSSLRLIMMIM